MLGKILFKSCTVTAMESYWNMMYVTIRTSFQTSYTINRDPEGCLSEPLRKVSERTLRAWSQHRFSSFVCPCRQTVVTLPRLYCVNPKACNHILIFIIQVIFHLTSVVNCFHINAVILCFLKKPLKYDINYCFRERYH